MSSALPRGAYALSEYAQFLFEQFIPLFTSELLKRQRTTERILFQLCLTCHIFSSLFFPFYFLSSDLSS